MTKTEIIAAVLGRVHRTADTVLQAACATEILVVQDKLELGVVTGQGAFIPWFLFYDKNDLSYTANTEAVAVPNDFIQEYEELHGGVLFYYDASSDDQWVPLVREAYAVIKGRYAELAEFPRFYDIINNNIYYRPRPNANGTFRLFYYRRQDRLDTVSSNPWTNNAAELMINELGYVIATQYIRDKAAAETFANQAAKEARRLYVSHISKLEAGRQRSRGDD